MHLFDFLKKHLNQKNFEFFLNEGYQAIVTALWQGGTKHDGCKLRQPFFFSISLPVRACVQTQILGEPTWTDLGAEGILASNDQDEQVGFIGCWAMERVGWLDMPK